MLKIIASVHILLFLTTSANLVVEPDRQTFWGTVPMIEQSKEPAQTLTVSAQAVTPELVRDSFTVELIPEPEPIVVVPEPVAPSAPSTPPVPAITGTPTSAQAYAYTQVVQRGWGENDYSCLVSLWERESNWNASAMNKSSGAYGIPQSLPGSKMASAGADWESNPNTQVNWGLTYISDRYSTPCEAWAHSESVGWY
jgi:hypothetical protein